MTRANCLRFLAQTAGIFTSSRNNNFPRDNRLIGFGFFMHFGNNISSQNSEAIAYEANGDGMGKSAFWKFWPEIDSRASAIQTTRQGVFAASLSCAVTAIFSALSIGGYSLFNLADATIFAVVAWRIYRQSLLWSIFGLVLFLGERVDGISTGTIKFNVEGWIFAAALVMCYLNSIRATWFLRKNKEPLAEPPDQAKIST